MRIWESRRGLSLYSCGGLHSVRVCRLRRLRRPMWWRLRAEEGVVNVGEWGVFESATLLSHGEWTALFACLTREARSLNVCHSFSGNQLAISGYRGLIALSSHPPRLGNADSVESGSVLATRRHHLRAFDASIVFLAPSFKFIGPYASSTRHMTASHLFRYHPWHQD
ncbi:hypothetical protein BC835DRAFT_385585 [Cytidiella melzeri]|nr:hypothetical protein BC835DRAFT_385585 [Cytidiella melzeri]